VNRASAVEVGQPPQISYGQHLLITTSHLCQDTWQEFSPHVVSWRLCVCSGPTAMDPHPGKSEDCGIFRRDKAAALLCGLVAIG
jgi:hypothetical protein